MHLKRGKRGDPTTEDTRCVITLPPVFWGVAEDGAEDGAIDELASAVAWSLSALGGGRRGEDPIDGGLDLLWARLL